MVSLRPRVEPAPGPWDGRAAVRLATSDLQRCSSEKANNPGVKEVVCDPSGEQVSTTNVRVCAEHVVSSWDTLFPVCKHVGVRGFHVR